MMNNERIPNVRIMNARMIKKNFEGRQTDYNDAGKRNFGVLLDDRLAEEMKMDGWPVKYLRPLPDDPEQHEQAWMPVKVKFGKIPPTVVLVTSRGKMRLDEDTVGQIDWTRIEKADMVIRPYRYPSIKGRSSGIAAYLKSLYVTVLEDDELAYEYADIPDYDVH